MEVKCHRANVCNVFLKCLGFAAFQCSVPLYLNIAIDTKTVPDVSKNYNIIIHVAFRYNERSFARK